MMSKWDTVATSIPTLVDRLQSVRDLHEEGASAIVRIQSVEKQIESVSQLMQQNKSALSKLSESFGTNVKTMQTNVSALETRINDVQQKMAKFKK